MTTPAAPTAMSRAHLGALLTVVAMAGFASMDSMSKLLVRDFPIVETLWIRYGIFLLFALAVTRGGGVRRQARSARPWLQMTRSLLGVVENGVFVLAFLYLPLADTHAVAAASPLIVVALAAVMLGERAGMRHWLAVLAGFLGVLMIIQPGMRTLSWPLLLPLLGAALWAVYQVLTRLCARYDPPGTTLLWTAAIGFAVLTLAAPWQWRAPDAVSWVLIVAVAVLGSLSHYALIRALDFASAGAVQPYSYTLLVFAGLLGWLVFGDIPDAAAITGAAIVVASGLYTWLQDWRSARGAADPVDSVSAVPGPAGRVR
jgi:drug/metabolite transporter (DMT)-like permease